MINVAGDVHGILQNFSLLIDDALLQNPLLNEFTPLIITLTVQKCCDRYSARFIVIWPFCWMLTLPFWQQNPMGPKAHHRQMCSVKITHIYQLQLSKNSKWGYFDLLPWFISFVGIAYLAISPNFLVLATFTFEQISHQNTKSNWIS